MINKNNRFRRMQIIALSAAVLLFTGAVWHHGWANYDQDTVLDYMATILANDIGNPHTYIDIEVHETGKEWNVVLAPLTQLGVWSVRSIGEGLLPPEFGAAVRLISNPRRRRPHHR
jgi:hypothetical protein